MKVPDSFRFFALAKIFLKKQNLSGNDSNDEKN